jgi:LppP/LprE lipoprotein/DnaJ domain
MDDLHKILQVRPGADDETIAAAYARLRRRYDPALGGPFADEAALRQIERAYALLSDPAARDHYEMSRLRDADPPPTRFGADGAAPAPPVTGPAARDPFGLESVRSAQGGAQRASPAVTWEGKESSPAAADAPAASPSADRPAEQGQTPSGGQADHNETIALPTPAVPRREKPGPAAPAGRRWLDSLPRGGVVPVIAGVLVVLGAALAGWGIIQAIDAAGDEEPQEAGVSQETTEPGQQSGDSAPQDTLAEPDVASSDALPDELRTFAEGVIAEYEDESGGYRIFNFVATTTPDDEVFYAAVAIQEDSDLLGQRVFFFIDDRYLGTDWEDAVRSVDSIASVSGGQVRVVYRTYVEGDEECCPSGQRFAVVYRYDGEFTSDGADPPAGMFVE